MEQEQGEYEGKPPVVEMMELFIYEEKNTEWFESHGYKLTKINWIPGDLVHLLVAKVGYTCIAR